MDPDRGSSPSKADPDPDARARGTKGQGFALAPPAPKRDKKPPLPFTIAALLKALHESSSGRVCIEPFDERHSSALVEVIRGLDAQKVGLDRVRLAGEWIRAGGISWSVAVGWVATTGKLADAIAKATEWDASGRPPLTANGRAPPTGRGLSAQDLAEMAARQRLEEEHGRDGR